MQAEGAVATTAEETLIALAQQGSLAAYNQLVTAYQSLIYNVAYRILGDADGAADATQDSFLKAYRKLGQFHGGSFRAWLLRIVTNTCYDQFRAHKTHADYPMPEEETGDEDGRQWRARSESPEDYVVRRELGARIQRFIQRLPAEQRTVVVLHDVEGLSYQEIAEIAGIPMGTIKSRLSRGRAYLREMLRPEHGRRGGWPAGEAEHRSSHLDTAPAGRALATCSPQ